MKASGLRPVGVGANCGRHKFWLGLNVFVPGPTEGGIAVVAGQLCSFAGACPSRGIPNTVVIHKNVISNRFITLLLMRADWHYRSPLAEMFRPERVDAGVSAWGCTLAYK